MAVLFFGSGERKVEGVQHLDISWQLNVQVKDVVLK